MMPISVRFADENDVATLSALGMSVFDATYGESSDPDDISEHVEKHFGESAVATAMANNDVHYLIATDGAQCAGLVKLCHNSVHELVPAATASEVQQVYVATDYQRMGVGRALMDAAVDISKKRGAAGVWLSVWKKAPWATSFYTGYGFSALGETPFYIGKTRYTDFLMWLPFDTR